MLVDTHAHLNFKDYEKDLGQVIERAKKAGVEKIVCVSSNIGDSEKAIEIAKKYPGVVYASVGIHPQQTDPENYDSLIGQIRQLDKLARQKEIVAIGECGLDFSPAPAGEKDRTMRDQRFLFSKQIELAHQLKKPLIVHSRKAFEETLYVLCSMHYVLNGVFHCYSAGKKGIEKVNQLGFYFGFDGNLTYDEGLQNIAKLIPLEKIVLETDAPFLAPEPYRHTRNEPANIKSIAQTLADIKHLSVKDISTITTQNAKNIFPQI